jgi:hypothetical protein
MSIFSRVKDWLSLHKLDDDDDDLSSPAWAVPVRKPPKEVDLPRFSGFANEGEISEAVDPQGSEGRRKLARAFPLAQPIASLRQFAGRRELLANAIRAIEERRLHLVLFGDRGIGKTSLLNVIALLAEDARYQVRYSSCSEGSNFDQTFRAIARDMPLLYHRGSDPTSDQVESGKTLADLLDERPVTPSVFSEILEGVAGTRLLIILDEFDRVESSDFRRSVAELIKNLSDRGSRAQILIGGVGPNLAELIRHIPSIRRSLLGVHVGKMPDEEIDEILSIGTAISKLPFAAASRRVLIHAANGSPYLTNLFAHQATSRAIDRHLGEVPLSAVQDSLSETLTGIRQRLDKLALAQLDALESTLSEADARRIARYAMHNFNVLESADSILLKAKLAVRLDASWSDAEGNFVFRDDSVPLALWLSQIVKS